MKPKEQWVTEMFSNPSRFTNGTIIGDGAISSNDIEDIQQDAYQAGLIKGLERAVEMAKNSPDPYGIIQDLQSEIQKRREQSPIARPPLSH